MTDERDYCFGQSSSATWGIIIGILIILAGLIEIFGGMYDWLQWDKLWPYMLITLGLLIIGNILYKR